jgi:hypothetical protein
MRNLGALLTALGLIFFWALLALGPTVTIIWIIVHFARKYW